MTDQVQPAGGDEQTRSPSMRVVVIGVCLALVAAALGYVFVFRSNANEVQVSALWYGKTASGDVVGGITPVDIAAVSDDPQSPLSVDVRGLESAGAGPMWTAATTTAGVQAVLDSGIDPRSEQLTYSLDEAIDGPSAGALLTVGSLAAINGQALSDSTTMTGTVLPDGSVGPVSGVPEKIRAAADAGFSRVLVPANLPLTFDSATGEATSLVDVGTSVGVDVVEVTSVAAAYRLMTDQDAAPTPTAAPPIDPEISQLLSTRTADLITATNKQLAALPKAAPQAKKITGLIGAASASLSANDPVLAYATAGEAGLAAALWQAELDVSKAVTSGSVSSAATQLADQVAASLVALNAQIRTSAEVPVTTISQFSALADSLTWGNFAATELEVALERLAAPVTKKELDELSVFVATAQFEGFTYMPTVSDSIPLLGGKVMTDTQATVSLMDAYADLLDYAADSNRDYAQALGSADRPTSFLSQLIEESDALTDSVQNEFPDLQGPTASTALRMSAALVDFVETTLVVNEVTRANYGADSLPNLEPIRDAALVESQAKTADEIAASLIPTVVGEGSDPSYMQWMSQWGSDLVFARVPTDTDEQTLRGLEDQWFAVLQGRLLNALGNNAAEE